VTCAALHDLAKQTPRRTTSPGYLDRAGWRLLFLTVSRCRLGGQTLQPFGQALELLVCAELVQAVNADVNRLGVVVGDTVDVFGAAHDLLIVAGAFILLVSQR
jgi:hypothetical protein